MMNVVQYAKDLGFSRCYSVSATSYEYYGIRKAEGTLHSSGAHLSEDARIDYPWAKTILVLAYAYAPFLPEKHTSGYYLASNRSYQLSKEFIKALKSSGLQAERVEVPVREILLKNAIGFACKNGLTYIPGLGTRFIIQTIATDCECDCSEKSQNEVGFQFFKTCLACHLCEKACPGQAIHEDGLHYRECIRSDMDGSIISEENLPKIRCLFGCEVCQYVCPLNRDCACGTDFPKEFELESILRGNIKEVKNLIGSNMNKGGRILQQAIIVSANNKRTDLIPLIEEYLESNQEAVKNAAHYALSVLRKS